MLDEANAIELGRTPHSLWEWPDRAELFHATPQLLGTILESAIQEPPVTTNIAAVATIATFHTTSRMETANNKVTNEEKAVAYTDVKPYADLEDKAIDHLRALEATNPGQQG